MVLSIRSSDATGKQKSLAGQHSRILKYRVASLKVLGSGMKGRKKAEKTLRR